MTTSIAIYTPERRFVSTFTDDMPLDRGMFEDGETFRYSVGTSDTDDTRAKMLFCQMVESLKKTYFLYFNST